MNKYRQFHEKLKRGKKKMGGLEWKAHNEKPNGKKYTHPVF